MGRAVVLLSGGLDSATCLAMARAEGLVCHALTIAYGQRHDAELRVAATVATTLGAVEHRVIRADLAALGGSALTDPSTAIPESPQPGVPPTYVPARNTVLLAIGLGWAETLGAGELHIGANAVDYSGYPDCRPAFMEAFQALADVATVAATEKGKRVQVRAPLLQLSKAQIIARGVDLGVDYSQTVTCYQADAQARACGRCDACRLRRQGFADAGIADPTRYRPGAK
ncbi:MAG: 7-cyano-7-deazaguanine synthase QueC [Salinisphaera sp.]|nr:7-cyano-7-deazaguanine synthase QueC [Salinisphaera sp.]